MANEVNKVSEQFSGLDMSQLIGGPLKAACDAEIMLAESTSKFIEQIDFEDSDDSKVRKVRTTGYSFTRPSDFTSECSETDMKKE